MTIANTKVLAKVVAAFAVAALALSAFALSASAQTTTTTTTTTSASSCASFNRDLTVGSSGADVTALQTWLISKGFAIAAGATGYFGGQTQAALAQYQASVKISPAAGYFGPITRAQVNAAACSNGGGSTGGDTDDDDDDDSDDSDDELDGGAGDLEDADFISSLNNEEVGEGDEEVEVAGLELTADDGSDLGLTAVRVMLEEVGGIASDELDDYIDSLHLMFNGEEIGSEDIDDIDEDDGEWSSTFSIDWEDAIIDADGSGDLTLAVTASENIDSDDLDDNEWEVTFEMVRYVDAQGATVSEDDLGDIGETRPFNFETFTSANDVELSIDETSDSPEAGTQEVDEDGGDEIVLLVGEFEAEGADLEITELPFRIDATGNTGDSSEVASEYLLMIDGEEVANIDSDECSTAADCDGLLVPGSATYVFDDLEIMIDEGETVEFEIVAVTEEIDGDPVAQGDSLEATVTDGDAALFEVEAEGEDLEAGDINGSANGEAQSFVFEGLAITYDEDASDASSDNNVGTFEFVLDVSAFGEDVTITEGDFNYTVDAPGGATYTTDEDVSESSDDIDEDPAGTFEIEENGDGTLTFTVFITIDAALDNGVYEVTLDDVDGVSVDETLSTFISFES